MILANSTWGGWLAELRRARHLPQPGQPRARREGAHGHQAAPHAGIGVKQYAWSTSPLRRYADLVNQWQIIACARHGRTAALAAPFKPKDAELFSIISGFDAAYAAYNGFQAGIERFWTLQYLQQHGIARARRPPCSRTAWCAPTTCRWCFRSLGADGLPRGARVRVRSATIDLITLDVHATRDRSASTTPRREPPSGRGRRTTTKRTGGAAR